jgi:hypothetical protein
MHRKEDKVQSNGNNIPSSYIDPAKKNAAPPFITPQQV